MFINVGKSINMTNSGLKNHREKTAQRADDENECGMHC
jgi:hypothetical protein